MKSVQTEVAHTATPTPGKWEVCGVTKVLVFGENHAAIAICCDPDKGTTTSDMVEASYDCKKLDQVAANARLIAAVHEILGQLEAANDQPVYGTEMDVAIRGAIKVAEAAISLATASQKENK